MNARKPQLWGLFIVALALGVRLAWIAAARHDPLLSLRAIDEVSYVKLAHQMAGGERNFGGETLWFPPLYPAGLALLEKLFGVDAPFVAGLLQHGCGVITAYLGFRLGTFVGGDVTGRVAGFLLAVLPSLVHAEGRLLYTAPLVLASAAFLWWFARSLEGRRPAKTDPQSSVAAGRFFDSVLLAGLALGVGAQFRGTMLAFAPFAAWGIFRARGRIASVRFVAALIVTLAPLFLWNGITSGEWTPLTSNGGMIFATAFDPSSLGGRALTRTPEDFGPGGAFHREAERAVGEPLTLAAAARYHERKTWDWIRAHPGEACRLTARKLLLLLNAAEIDDNLGYPLAEESFPFLRWIPSGWGITLLLAVFGLCCWGGPTSGAWKWVAGFAFVNAAILVCYFVTSRYRIPLLVPLAIVAGRGVEVGLRAFHGKTLRKLVVPGLAALVALPFVFRSPGAKADPALTWIAVGAAFEDRGDHARALDYTQRGLRADPEIAGGWLNLSLAYLGLGREREALRAVDHAARLDPNLVEAWQTRGAILARTGRVAEAVPAFETAAKLAPQDPTVLENLARAYAATDRRTDAISWGRRAVDAGAREFSLEVESWAREATPQTPSTDALPLPQGEK